MKRRIGEWVALCIVSAAVLVGLAEGLMMLWNGGRP